MTAAVHTNQTNFNLKNVGGSLLADNSHLLLISLSLAHISLSIALPLNITGQVCH